MRGVRPPAVAGMFYAAEPSRLRAVVNSLLAPTRVVGPPPKALIVPHAGYVYSGPIAASGYAHLIAARAVIERVVVLGPAHYHRVRGFAVSRAIAFATPLGVVPVDRGTVERLLEQPGVRADEEAHRREHSIEVQLPFLQVVLSRFEVVPLLAGEATEAEVADVLEQIWGGPETAVVVSSDLSHYHAYAEACARDERTSQAIARLDPDGVGAHDACGHVCVRGLLALARRRRLGARILDLRNSGDTAGCRDEVVGYGAYAFSP